MLRRPFRSFLALPILLLVLAAAPSGAATYTIDPVHSSLVFKVRHFNVSNVYGRFNELSGTIEFDPSAPEKSSVSVEVKAASVDTHAQGRDDHLRSADFFNAAQFPTISFVSTSVRKTGDATYEVQGDLTLLGVTKPVTLAVEKTGEGTHPRSQKPLIGFEAHTRIERSQWGMEFMKGPLSDWVDLILAVEARVD